MEITDFDGDGLNDSLEDAGPNSGDANNDGVLDSRQIHVASFANSVSSTQTVFEANTLCAFTSATTQAEMANDAQDPGFGYPAGLVNFELDCGTPGFTTEIKIYGYGLSGSDYVLKKYNPNTQGYTYLEDATIVSTSIGGQNVLVGTYSLTDGGEFDLDGEANGVIVDPVGFAIPEVTSPETGFGFLGNSAR